MKHERSDYPHLADIIDEIAGDNGWHHYGVRLWEWPEAENLAYLEDLAAALTLDEKITMACGEHTEVETLVKECGLQELNEFLEQVFDGKYSGNFLNDLG